jgi:hypothetical protein
LRDTSRVRTLFLSTEAERFFVRDLDRARRAPSVGTRATILERATYHTPIDSIGPGLSIGRTGSTRSIDVR